MAAVEAGVRSPLAGILIMPLAPLVTLSLVFMMRAATESLPSLGPSESLGRLALRQPPAATQREVVPVLAGGQVDRQFPHVGEGRVLAQITHTS